MNKLIKKVLIAILAILSLGVCQVSTAQAKDILLACNGYEQFSNGDTNSRVLRSLVLRDRNLLLLDGRYFNAIHQDYRVYFKHDNHEDFGQITGVYDTITKQLHYTNTKNNFTREYRAICK